MIFVQNLRCALSNLATFSAILAFCKQLSCASPWKGLQQGGYAPGYDNYRIYFNSWFRFFDNLDTQDCLDDALSWLPESSCAITLVRDGKIIAPELKHLAESPMFRNRIADMRLCCFFS